MDPAALVYKDRLYLFTGVEQSENPYNWPFIATHWRIYSTSDMLTYTDHGNQLSGADFDWMPENACWASHCVEKNGKFYWYVCNYGNLGVADSDNILGPYNDALGRPMLERAVNGINNIDPHCFIDRDGKAYLYWGGEGELYVCKLKDSMVELDGEPILLHSNNADKGAEISEFYEEAPWVWRRGDTYYLVYSASNGYRRGPLRYAISSSPLGPWKDQDDILGPAYNSFSNHGSIVDFNGKTYIFYHNGALEGGGDYARSVCVERLFYREDGSIKFVEQTASGINGNNNVVAHNYLPNVYAGMDSSTVLPYPAKVNSRVFDDGRGTKALLWDWSVIDGPGEVRHHMRSLRGADLYFSKPGHYTLELTAGDGIGARSDRVKVSVHAEPKGDTYEAEDYIGGSLSWKVSQNSYASGNRVAQLTVGAGTFVVDDVRVPEQGEYQVSICYASRVQNAIVEVNGRKVELPKTSGGYFDAFGIADINIKLSPRDKIVIMARNGLSSIDRVVIGPEAQ